MTKKNIIWLFLISFLAWHCTTKNEIATKEWAPYLHIQKNNLDYQITPSHKFDKKGLMFSDQGAWFAFSVPDSLNITGFTGPFLMTQQNGIWASQTLAELAIKDVQWLQHKTASYASHLEQVFTSKDLELTQKLFFASGHTALIQSTLKNISTEKITVEYHWKNAPILADGLTFSTQLNEVQITSSKTNAVGHLVFPKGTQIQQNNKQYTTKNTATTLAPGTTKKLLLSQSFIFPEYNWNLEKEQLQKANFDILLQKRISEKGQQLKDLLDQRKPQFQDSAYAAVLAKAQLTLQNNWRIPAGEIKHEGLFPSYHYVWFHGFWSWDSWKHSVGLSYYDVSLAKKQLKLMFEFQNEDGFVADVVYRDTSIEAHNYRDTKPPLSAWAVVKIYEKDQDLAFVEYMYPKLKKYHRKSGRF
jgi:putative isomerase